MRPGRRAAVASTVAAVGILAASCSGSGSSDGPVGDAAANDAAAIGDGASPANDAGAGADADADATADAEPTVTTSVITSAHRFVPGAMFGGWGPHLGHLLRRAVPDEEYFADDACDQAGIPDACDVNVDKRVDYYRLAAGAWTRVASQPLPATVQQNTASLLVGSTIFTYGVDVANARLVECTLDLGSLAKSCAPLSVTVGPSANYIGAALAPDGTRVVWLTNVKDGGGGQFQWYADYGSGWNGPRTGGVGGYNDASYIHVAFGAGANKNEMLMHVQLVSGLAPSWGFVGAVGEIDLASTNAATFSTALAPLAAGDPIMSTDDVAIDPATNDAHLFARTTNGDAVYYHRPLGGAWSAPLFSLPSSYRARLVAASDGTLFVVYGPKGKGLAWRASPAGSRPAGQPIAWGALAEHVAPVPAAYADVLAIYPESSVYQSAPAARLRVAIVGTTTQNEALYVAVDP